MGWRRQLAEEPFELRPQGQMGSSRQPPQSWTKGTAGPSEAVLRPREGTQGLWETKKGIVAARHRLIFPVREEMAGVPAKAQEDPASPPRNSPNSHTRPSCPGGILPTSSGSPGLCGVERAGEPSRGKVEDFEDRGGSMGQGMQGMLPCISREALASYWPVEKIPRLARRKTRGVGGVQGDGGAGEVGCPQPGPEIPRESFLTPPGRREGRQVFQLPPFVHNWVPPISQLGDTQQLYMLR